MFKNNQSANTGTTFAKIMYGNFVIEATKDTPGAKERFSENKNANVYELEFNECENVIIKSLQVRESQFGEQLNVAVEANGKTSVIQMPVASNYFDSFCEKIKRVDFKNPVNLTVYEFTNDKQKRVSGINIFQQGKKLEKYYTRETPNGRPQPASDNMSKDDWKIYFLQVKKFYKEMIANLNMAPSKSEPAEEVHSIENTNDDLPF